MTHFGVSRMNVCGTFSSGTHALASLIVEAKERDMREHRKRHVFWRPARYLRDLVRPHSDCRQISPRENMDVLSSRCFSALFFIFSFSLFIRWLIHLFSPSPLVLLYFYSLSPYWISIRPFIGHCLSLNFTLYYPHAPNGLTQHRFALISNAITINRHFKVKNLKIFYKCNIIYFLFLIIIDIQNISKLFFCPLNSRFFDQFVKTIVPQQNY